VGMAKETVKVFLFLASPFVKGGEQSEGAEGDFYKS